MVEQLMNLLLKYKSVTKQSCVLQRITKSQTKLIGLQRSHSFSDLLKTEPAQGHKRKKHLLISISSNLCCWNYMHISQPKH